MRNSSGSPMSWESSSEDTRFKKFRSSERSLSPCAVHTIVFLVSSNRRRVGSQSALKRFEPIPLGGSVCVCVYGEGGGTGRDGGRRDE